MKQGIWLEGGMHGGWKDGLEEGEKIEVVINGRRAGWRGGGMDVKGERWRKRCMRGRREEGWRKGGKKRGRNDAWRNT